MDMRRQIATMPKESRRLLRAGVDPETADMYYTTEKAPIYEDVMDTVDVLHNISCDTGQQIQEDGATIPAWSLERLLDLIPKKIYRPDPSLCDSDNPDEIPPIMEWYWEMTATDRVSYEDEKTGIKFTEEPRYAITYCSYQVLPPTHPIAPIPLTARCSLTTTAITWDL